MQTACQALTQTPRDELPLPAKLCQPQPRPSLEFSRNVVVRHLLVLNRLLPHRKGVSSFRLGASLLQEITEHVDMSDSVQQRYKTTNPHSSSLLANLNSARKQTLAVEPTSALTSSTTSFMLRVHTRLQESRNFAISSGRIEIERCKDQLRPPI